MSAEREVRIYGQVYHLKGHDHQRIDRVAGYVDGMMAQLLGGPVQGLSPRGAVLTALNIADEWFSYKDEAERVIRELDARMDELLGLLPK